MGYFETLVEGSGVRKKAAYTLQEVSRVSGVKYGAIAAAAREGRIKTFLPPGCKRGRLVRPEWFDEYWNDGIEGGS